MSKALVWVWSLGIFLAGCGAPAAKFDAKAEAEKMLAEVQASRLAAAKLPPTGNQPPFDNSLAQLFNSYLGFPLYKAGRSLWDELPAVVAERIRLQLSTKTPSHEVYSRDRDWGFVLGAMPDDVLLYGRNHRVEEVLLAYANRGRLLPGQFAERLKSDDAAVRRSLEHMLGEQPLVPRRHAGLDYETKEWETPAGTVTFFSLANDFVAVSIRRPGLAKAASAVPARAVRRYERGDVLIGDIPQLRQGERPYCVPITIERVLRYLGVCNNMYGLAASGGVTHLGCGTLKPFDQMDSALRQRGFQLKTQQKGYEGLNLRLTSSLDKGLPVIWLIHGYVPTFLKARERQNARESSDVGGQWKQNLEGHANKVQTMPGQYHACLINGYNARTGEIAVLDEIGQLWISEQEARTVTERWMFFVERE
jgi:hypothetical protein